MTDDELRRVLHDAVPDLAAPEDRLATVGARVRRARHRVGLGATLAAVVAVGLAIGVPRLAVGPAPGPEPDTVAVSPTGSPPSPPPLSTDDRPGPLVRTGATQVTLCERMHAPGPDPRDGQPRSLTIGVDAVVARLNELPNAETMLAKYRELARQQGKDPNNLGLACTLRSYPAQLSLALRFPDGSTTVVWLDRNCGTASANGRTRFGEVLDLFLRLYREQLVTMTQPATIADPACPPRITADELGGQRAGTRPSDEIARNRGDADGTPFLPSPLAKLTLCRYGPVTGGTAPLVRGAPVTDPEPLRDGLNRATTVQVSTDANGVSTATNVAECLQMPDLTRASLVDLIRLADRTGAVAELAVFRQPCGAVFRFGRGGLVPTPELLALLDAALGPTG